MTAELCASARFSAISVFFPGRQASRGLSQRKVASLFFGIEAGNLGVPTKPRLRFRSIRGEYEHEARCCGVPRAATAARLHGLCGRAAFFDGGRAGHLYQMVEGGSAARHGVALSARPVLPVDLLV